MQTSIKRFLKKYFPEEIAADLLSSSIVNHAPHSRDSSIKTRKPYSQIPNRTIIQIPFSATRSGKRRFELAEFVGDTIANLCMGIYITKRFSQVTNRTWLSKLHDKLKSTEFFGKMGRVFGELVDYEGTSSSRGGGSSSLGSGKTEDERREDTLEAFYECVFVCLNRIHPIDTVFEILLSFTRKVADPIRVPLQPTNVFSFKELCKYIYDAALGIHVQQRALRENLSTSEITEEMKKTIDFQDYKTSPPDYILRIYKLRPQDLTTLSTLTDPKRIFQRLYKVLNSGFFNQKLSSLLIDSNIGSAFSYPLENTRRPNKNPLRRIYDDLQRKYEEKFSTPSSSGSGVEFPPPLEAVIEKEKEKISSPEVFPRILELVLQFDSKRVLELDTPSTDRGPVSRGKLNILNRMMKYMPLSAPPTIYDFEGQESNTVPVEFGHDSVEFLRDIVTDRFVFEKYTRFFYGINQRKRDKKYNSLTDCRLNNCILLGNLLTKFFIVKMSQEVTWDHRWESNFYTGKTSLTSQQIFEEKIEKIDFENENTRRITRKINDFYTIISENETPFMRNEWIGGNMYNHFIKGNGIISPFERMVIESEIFGSEVYDSLGRDLDNPSRIMKVLGWKGLLSRETDRFKLLIGTLFSLGFSIYDLYSFFVFMIRESRGQGEFFNFSTVLEDTQSSVLESPIVVKVQFPKNSQTRKKVKFSESRENGVPRMFLSPLRVTAEGDGSVSTDLTDEIPEIELYGNTNINIQQIIRTYAKQKMFEILFPRFAF